MTRTRVALLLLSTTLLVLAFSSITQSAAARGITRGFADDVWFRGTPSQNTAWVKRTVATGAKRAQIEVDWVSVEPNAPAPGANLTNPSAPQFNFSYLDSRVEELTSHGLQPVFLVTDAPRWAQGSGGASTDYATGGYKPNATALGHLAQAMARRYSGSYPDPLHPGRKLPRVRFYQAWAEANLNIHLSPQWTRSHGRWVNSGATIYRRMLNKFYAGVKAGDSRAKVLLSGLAPYGDPPATGLWRTHPVVFLRNVLCINNKLKRRCRARSHFNVLAADAYDVGPPTQHAISSLDASTPDLNRLQRVVKAAVKHRTLLPTSSKPTWVTEFSYDSRPPNPSKFAPSLSKQAHWLEEGLYVLWAQHVQTALWYLVSDQPPPYTINYASGVYFQSGKRKKSFRAYRFPFVVKSVGTRERVWGISPIRGKVKVQRKIHRRWRTIATFRRRPGRVFTKKMPRHRGRYRAVVNRQKSIVWHY